MCTGFRVDLEVGISVNVLLVWKHQDCFSAGVLPECNPHTLGVQAFPKSK